MRRKKKSHTHPALLFRRGTVVSQGGTCVAAAGARVSAPLSQSPRSSTFPGGGAAGPGLGSLLLNEEVLPCFYVKKESI